MVRRIFLFGVGGGGEVYGPMWASARRTAHPNFYRCNRERQRRRKEVDSSYATKTESFCEHAVNGYKYEKETACRKSRNLGFWLFFWSLLEQRPKVTRARGTEYPFHPAAIKHPIKNGRKAVFYQSLSNLRTAMKASVGTWTVPRFRIFFLPSFCFSSSFFLRVMSPP